MLDRNVIMLQIKKTKNKKQNIKPVYPDKISGHVKAMFYLLQRNT